MKYCSSCKQNKPDIHFFPSCKTGDWCIQCRKEYNDKKRYGDNRAKELRQRKNRHLIRTYGITLIDYEALLLKQDGKCAICLGVGKQALAVDHNHETGAVRGLLCNKCNTGLGNLRESEANLLRAVDYIRLYET